MTKTHKTALEPLWQEIDALDIEVLKTLARRDAIRRKLAAFKMQNDVPVKIEGRREEIMSSIISIAEELELERDFVEKIYGVIIDHSLDYEHRIRNKEIV